MKSVFGCDEAPIIVVSGQRLTTIRMRGLQVGRFFVRSRIDDEFTHQRRVETGKGQWVYDWIVTHLNTGICWSFANLNVALVVADEISRNAQRDPNTRSRDFTTLRKQLGEPLCAWLESLEDDAESVTPFRAWLAERAT